MIWALKEAFMGYIGLLLNAPYKIDSMVWMRMWMRMRRRLMICLNLLYSRVNEPKIEISVFCYIMGFRGATLVLHILRIKARFIGVWFI
jgi:hypothetical protein